MSNFYLRNDGIIYLRYYFQGEPNSIRFSTKIKIDPEKWDNNKQKAKSSKQTFEGKRINPELKRHERAFEKAIQFYEQNSGFSKSNVRQKYLEFLSPGLVNIKKSNTSTFLEYFETLVNKYETNGQAIYKEYRTTYNHLKKYFGIRSLLFEEIDSKFYKEYNDYLQGKGFAVNNISKHWKHIKAVMNDAFMMKLHKNDSFKYFKRKRENVDSIYLTMDEIKRIYELKLKGNLDLVRDYFVIGCLTGLRYSDWDKVSNEAIKDRQLEIVSDKTGERSIIPIHPIVRRILKKYKGSLPKKLSNQNTNDKLKIIGLMAKINDEITIRKTKGVKKVSTITKKYNLICTHTARRSFATNLILDGVNAHLIMEMTGHVSLGTFEKYVQINKISARIELGKIKFFK